jgi:signal transduction histidine kinase/DNA-binding response OmpR family regulator
VIDNPASDTRPRSGLDSGAITAKGKPLMRSQARTNTFDAELSFLAGAGEMAEQTRSMDWSRSTLGRADEWPRSLKTAVGLMLSSRYAMFVWWGRELINLYNDAYRPFLGGKHPRALGQSARDVWAEIWDLIGPRTDAVLERGESTFDEALLLIMERYGYPEETYFTFSYSPIRDDHGAVGGLFCAVTDETQRVIGERRLKLLREVAANFAETNVPERVCTAAAECMALSARDLPFALLYLTEPDGRSARLVALAGIQTTSPAAAATVPLQDPGGVWPLARAEDLVLLDDLPSRCQDLPCGAWDRPPARAVIVPLKEQGRGVPAGFLVAGLNPYLAFDEGYRGFLGLLAVQIAAGIGNARAYEQERRRAEALAEIDRAKTAFFSNVSHEFRTPLTLMLGPIEDALGVLEDPIQVRTHLEIAQRNAQRLLKLVNSLLDFSRIEAGRTQASFVPVDLTALTVDLSSTFRSAMQRAQLDFEVDCKPLGEPAHVDTEMWEKIVLNLLSNAFKFTLQGAVHVRLQRIAGQAVLEVSDTGVGVPAEEIPRLFDRFHRVAGTQARTHEGSGIGLALVHELVKLHGGSIEVNSRLGEGTSFCVRLPLGTAHIPAERIKVARSLAASTVANAYLQEALRWLPDGEAGLAPASVASTASHAVNRDARFASTHGARVLLADDNADMRNYVRQLLSSMYQVEIVADGAQALAAARRQRPDLIISDAMMPELDGFALLQAVRADRGLYDVPVILLSARAGEESRIDGLGAGADDYIVKPFHARELLARVGAMLELTALRRKSEGRFRAYVQASSDVVYRMSADWSEMLHLEGRNFVADQTDPSRGWLQKYVLEEDQPQVLAAIGAAIREKRPLELEQRVIRANGSTGWAFSRAVPLLDDHGEIVEWFGAATDVTARREAQEVQRMAERAVREERRTLEILNRAGSALAVETDVNRLVQIVTDAGVELSGAQFGAFFYNVQDERGESYTLYTLSGAPAAAFSTFPMPRNTEVFAPTFSGTGIVRSDDITQDPRYGNAPGHGMPNGHLPVHSYLAVPVVSRDGKVIGGLFFGHAASGVFTERSERGMTGLAAQAAVAIDNAYLAKAAQREIAERARAQEALRDLNANLEREIADRTEQLRKQEEALRQAQKMEAVGQLTGGVAHDFNNLLQVIVGNLDVIRRLVPAESSRIQRAAEHAMSGARQATSLTQQLLAFSRRQPLDPKPIDVNALVGGMSDLLNRSLGETISVETVRSAGLWKVEVDPNALESAILNLAVNARDAMPEGGCLTIETMNAHIDADYATTHAEVVPGQYVAVSVSDTGAGMEEETLRRAFEPFFTTKPVGKGTGLGLSQVYGFVKQSGGHVKIYSEVGEGTTVKIYLPRLERSSIEATAEQPLPVPKGAPEETILVLEDDMNVRAYSSEVLRELGYRILEAPDGQTALHMLEGQTRVDLLFTDVVLPGGMTGAQVAARARELHPALKVLFTTGYARNAIVHQGRLDKGVQLITKPFGFNELAIKVRDVLDGLQR